MSERFEGRPAVAILRKALVNAVGLAPKEADDFIEMLAHELSSGRNFDDAVLREVFEKFLKQRAPQAGPLSALAKQFGFVLATIGLSVIANLLTDELRVLYQRKRLVPPARHHKTRRIQLVSAAARELRELFSELRDTAGHSLAFSRFLVAVLRYARTHPAEFDRLETQRSYVKCDPGSLVFELSIEDLEYFRSWAATNGVSLLTFLDHIFCEAVRSSVWQRLKEELYRMR